MSVESKSRIYQVRKAGEREGALIEGKQGVGKDFTKIIKGAQKIATRLGNLMTTNGTKEA